VVVPAQDTDPAGRTMATARWHLALALVAVAAEKENKSVPQIMPRVNLGAPPE
jgi:hypothetical protein